VAAGWAGLGWAGLGWAGRAVLRARGGGGGGGGGASPPEARPCRYPSQLALSRALVSTPGQLVAALASPAVSLIVLVDDVQARGAPLVSP
jgi:hypothetical protein